MLRAIIFEFVSRVVSAEKKRNLGKLKDEIYLRNKNVFHIKVTLVLYFIFYFYRLAENNFFCVCFLIPGYFQDDV